MDFTMKYSSNGCIERYRARLVAQGYVIKFMALIIGTQLLR